MFCTKIAQNYYIIMNANSITCLFFKKKTCKRFHFTCFLLIFAQKEREMKKFLATVSLALLMMGFMACSTNGTMKMLHQKVDVPCHCMVLEV